MTSEPAEDAGASRSQDSARTSVWGIAGVRTLLLLAPIAFAAYALMTRIDDVREAYGSSVRSAGDFSYLRNAARTLRTGEPQALYEGVADREAWRAEHGFNLPGSYPYAPAVAYAMLPLTVVDSGPAFTIWKGGVALASAGLALAAASQFRSRLWQVAVVLALITWWPVLLNAKIGQTGAFIAALVALGSLVLLRNRRFGAALLALSVLKPSTILGPALIVWPERPRVWLTCAGVAAIVALLPFLWLGPEALFGWIDILRGTASRDLTGGHSYNQGLTALIGFEGLAGRLAFVALIVASMLGVNEIHKRGGVAAAAAVAVLVGLLLNPHSLIYEWGLAFASVMLIRRSLTVAPQSADLVCGLLIVTLFFAGHWEPRDPIIKPLTAWALATGVAFALYTVWSARDRPRLLTQPAT